MKRINLIVIILIYLLTSIQIVQSADKDSVIFDTDMAIDDWAALLFLSMHPKLNLLAVTVNGAGESRCSPALENIPKLLDLATKKTIEYSCGDKYPLDGFFAFPEPWRVQADTLSGVELPLSKRTASKLHSVDLLHNKIVKNKDKIILVTAGSLTTIAHWLAKYPQDKDKISRLIIMGGAFDVPGNIIVPGFTDNHPNKYAEWNIFVDPKAAKIVFASKLPIEIVGLDVTNQVLVTDKFAKLFKSRKKTKAAEFWDQVLDKNKEFIASGEYYFWDVLAAIVAAEPDLCQGTYESVRVAIKSAKSPWQPSSLKTIPELTLIGERRQHFDAASAGITRVGGKNPPVKICRKTDKNKVFEIFINTLNNDN